MKKGKGLSIIMVFFLILACRDGKKYHDEKVIPLTGTPFEKEIMAFQHEKNVEFKNPENSPLLDRHRKEFEGLDFYAPDSLYRVKAVLEVTPNTKTFMMPNTQGEADEERVYGLVHFTLKGQNFTLPIYQSTELLQTEKYKDYLFLPFSDDTNGETTYGGGRYLDLIIPENNQLIIDFNKAYNPYCAYNPKFSCPIVPSQNYLNIKILAGEKAFKKP
jgi:uncharacterized protein (DUF1684 family)